MNQKTVYIILGVAILFVLAISLAVLYTMDIDKLVGRYQHILESELKFDISVRAPLGFLFALLGFAGGLLIGIGVSKK